MNFMGLSVGTAIANTDWVIAVVDILGVKTDVRIPKSLMAGAVPPNSKLPMRGDNAGGLIAQVIQAVGNVGTATINPTTDVVVISATLTAPLTLTLPSLSVMPAGHQIEVRDPRGYVSSTNTVSVVRAGADTVNTATAAVVTLNVPRTSNTAKVSMALDDWGVASNVVANFNLPAKGNNTGGLSPLSVFSGGDANTTITNGSNIILITAPFTANRTYTLPASASYTIGDTIRILDPNGYLSQAFSLFLIRGGSDTFNGLTTAQNVTSTSRQQASVTLGAAGAWGQTDLVVPASRSVVGFTDGTNASTGIVGEYFSASAGPTAMTNGVGISIGSLTLPAGDWDVWASGGFTAGATTTVSYWAVTCSATLNGGIVGGLCNTVLWSNTVPPAIAPYLVSPAVRVSSSGSTTVYCNMQSGFGVSTMQGSGFLYARRVR